jgi:hypothetical protein
MDAVKGGVSLEAVSNLPAGHIGDNFDHSLIAPEHLDAIPRTPPRDRPNDITQGELWVHILEEQSVKNLGYGIAHDKIAMPAENKYREAHGQLPIANELIRDVNSGFNWLGGRKDVMNYWPLVGGSRLDPTFQIILEDGRVRIWSRPW